MCYYRTVWCVSGEAVELEEYDGSAAGLIQSFTQRFTEDAEELETQLLEMVSRDTAHWCWEEHCTLMAVSQRMTALNLQIQTASEQMMINWERKRVSLNTIVGKCPQKIRRSVKSDLLHTHAQHLMLCLFFHRPHLLFPLNALFTNVRFFI